MLVASSSTASQAVTAENPLLGYRLGLPGGYRRSASLFVPGTGTFLGRDIYTMLAVGEARSSCLEEHNTGMPSLDAAKAFKVEVYVKPAPTSALDWARGAPLSRRATLEAATIGALDAARVVEDGKTYGYAIGANDRVYLIAPLLGPSLHPLDDIAATFSVLPAQPRPGPASMRDPREAAGELATRLASALVTRNADAVASLLPACLLGVAAVIDGRPAGGALNVPVTSFIGALRDRFARRDLTVTLDPQVLSTGDRFFVRSTWSEAERTMQVDLFLDPTVEGSWQWTEASLHFRRADVTRRGCIPYRSPWVTGPSSC